MRRSVSFALAAICLAASVPAVGDDVLFKAKLGPLGPNRLITNEFAYWNPKSTEAVVSDDWELDSGSLFSKGGAGWTGSPDDRAPNATSSSGNNSAVFRLTTKRKDFGDVDVSFTLINKGLHATPSTPEQPYDGVHVFLRYQSEYNLYYASVNRRENDIVIKKKVPGGTENGGTYYELTPYVPCRVPYGKKQRIRVTVRNEAPGTVRIEIYIEGKRVLSALDDGTLGGPSIVAPGKVGLRVDNAEIFFSDFVVTGSRPR